MHDVSYMYKSTTIFFAGQKKLHLFGMYLRLRCACVCVSMYARVHVCVACIPTRSVPESAPRKHMHVQLFFRDEVNKKSLISVDCTLKRFDTVTVTQ